MLICFGAAWPFSIYRSYRCRETCGKSILFLFIVFFGYLSGIMHKIFYHPDKVIIFYIINSTLVFIDILLYWRNYFYQRKLKSGQLDP